MEPFRAGKIKGPRIFRERFVNQETELTN